jgi:hypothetical protein
MRFKATGAAVAPERTSMRGQNLATKYQMLMSEVYKSRAMTDITQTTVENHNPPDSSPA